MKALWDSGAAFVKLDAVSPALVSSVMQAAWTYDLRVAGHVEVQYSVRDLARAGLRSVEHLDGVLLASSPAEDSLRRVLVRQQGYSLWHRVLTKLGVRTPLAYPETVMLQRFDSARADSLYAVFRETGTWHCPTLRLLGALYREQDANLRLAPDSLLLRRVPPRANGFAESAFATEHPLASVYAGLQRVVRGMARSGVGILAGTDTPGLHAVPGRSLHEELGLLVAAGLTPRQALHAATSGAADFLEARDSLGTIRPGAFADLVLLDADPLADIGNTRRIHGVVARGRYFDRSALDRMIGNAARVAARVRGGS
jgi:imidazolonepropionase-like amidohydrolase